MTRRAADEVRVDDGGASPLSQPPTPSADDAAAADAAAAAAAAAAADAVRATPPASPPSPPLMLATMTPVSVIELQKDLCDAAAAADHAAKAAYEEAAAAAAAGIVNVGGMTVVQAPPQLFGAPAGPATTVLVLSELVDDMAPVIGLSGRPVVRVPCGVEARQLSRWLTFAAAVASVRGRCVPPARRVTQRALRFPHREADHAAP
ncbi:uncharacterized protein LOC126263508 [Schistocerca nitens]|uniref:uncharacterized protein LOC126263508 n=1 Tax=Schistocerca nitens TaxID=7011 RepID=UPI0021187C1C|nr:uncharacterized protein LOC126263508 [Schistocerca nitens]